MAVDVVGWPPFPDFCGVTQYHGNSKVFDPPLSRGNKSPLASFVVEMMFSSYVIELEFLPQGFSTRKTPRILFCPVLSKVGVFPFPYALETLLDLELTEKSLIPPT